MQVVRYVFFPACARRFELETSSLLEQGRDEEERDGMLASALHVLQKVSHSSRAACQPTTNSSCTSDGAGLPQNAYCWKRTVAAQHCFQDLTAKEQTVLLHAICRCMRAFLLRGLAAASRT